MTFSIEDLIELTPSPHPDKDYTIRNMVFITYFCCRLKRSPSSVLRAGPPQRPHRIRTQTNLLTFQLVVWL